MNATAVVTFFLLCSLLCSPFLNASSLNECPRGSLDARFCDRDDDLLADPPGNSAKWLDPYPLIFAYSPVEDPIVYRDAWVDFIVYLGQVTGRKIELFPIQSNAAEIEAMRVGKIHVAGFNSGSNPLAVNCAGFHPFAIMAREDGSFGYKMEIITYPGSKIEQVSDIKGRLLAFTAPTSNSGFKAAAFLLEEDFGLVKGKDYRFKFSGRHDSSILGVKNKRYPAASIADSVRKRMLNRGLLQERDISVIYQSEAFPNTGFGYVYNLKPSLIADIQRAFKTFEWNNKDGSPSSLKKEFSSSGYTQFVPISYKDDWSVIRRVDRANRISYSCK